jgi:GNAT superfamily N-acetyltransferase
MRAGLNIMPTQVVKSVWVISGEGEIVGYVVITLGFSLEYLGRDAFVDGLYVTPEWRGKGLGRRALRVVEDACRELEVNALHLAVERDKADVWRVYQTAGFERHERYLMTRWLIPPRKR